MGEMTPGYDKYGNVRKPSSKTKLNTRGKPYNSEKIAIKHAAIAELHNQGFQGREIAKVVGYGEEYVSRIRQSLQNRLPPMVTKKRAKLALKVLDVAMEGFTGKKDSATGEMKYDERVKPSDAIASSRIVVDRGYPTEQAASGGQGQSFTQINIEQVTLLSSPPPEKNPEEKEK